MHVVGRRDLMKPVHDAYHASDIYAVLRKMQQQQQQLSPRRLEEDVDSMTGLSASDTFSFVDSCSSPHSPYSPLSPPPLSCHSNRLNMEMEAASQFPCSEESVPVCYDFVQGRCARNNCKYLHDSQKIEKTHSSKRGICFDYLRGDCNRGAMCRFSHDVTNFAQDYKLEDDISLAKVKRWGQGICFDFVRGACSRGGACPWSHNLLEIAVATKRGIENMTTSERNRIAATVRQRLCASLENKSEKDYESQRHEMISAPPSARSSTTIETSDWVSLWDYPANIFGPLDEFGRPLHWFTDVPTDFTEV